MENRKTHIHFMGIGGSGVSGVALLAKKSGFRVSGCDLEKDTAYLPKIRKFIPDIFVGHSKSHLKGVDFLVVSPAIFFQNKKHPEVLNAARVLTWQEFLGKYLHQGKKVIAIAGTHGKSTVTAMTSLLFERAGLEPTAVVGATVPEWGENVKFGKGVYFITEADEFYDNFLNYRPTAIILTNIEFDHPDFFKSEKQLLNSFADFVKNLKGEKILIVNQDSPGIKRVFDLLGATFLSNLRLFGYSLGPHLINVAHSITGSIIEQNERGTRFRAKSSYLNINKVFSLKVPGVHNVANALGVILTAKLFGIKDEVLEESLLIYSGIGRRLEFLGEKSGIKVYDDYAHHPTAIEATISALRQLFPRQRIWAIVEAHSYSRTKALLRRYKGVFGAADKVIVGPIFRARDTTTFGITEESIVKASGKINARAASSLEDIIDLLKKETKKGDVILVMGAGKSYDWSRRILSSLSNFILEKNIPFTGLTTFKIGGMAKYLARVKTKEDLQEAISFAEKENMPIFVLGGGSDILISDSGFDGLVIKYVGENVNFTKEGKSVLVTAEAGLIWDKLVSLAVSKNLQGIECMSGIPGTVGASPIQNIGAYGQELKDVFVILRAYDIKEENFVNLTKKDCEFTYRESMFKKVENKGRYLITDITLKLKKNQPPLLIYESLINYLNDRKIKNPTLWEVRDAVLDLRGKKLDDPKVIGNAGSFFKNPIVDKRTLKKLISKYPDIPSYAVDKKSVKLFAGWLIERTGWKGKKYKNTQVSKKNALVITNPDGNATAEEIKELADNISNDVYKKFGVHLVPEVQYIGFE